MPMAFSWRMLPLISEQYNTFLVRNSFYMQCIMYNGEESSIMKNKNEKEKLTKGVPFL